MPYNSGIRQLKNQDPNGKRVKEAFDPFTSILRVCEYRMEPERHTMTELLSIQQELSEREPIFHRPEYGTTRIAFEAMTAEDFWEVGASGRRYSRQFVLDTLEPRYSEPHRVDWKTEDFYCQECVSVKIFNRRCVGGRS